MFIGPCSMSGWGISPLVVLRQTKAAYCPPKPESNFPLTARRDQTRPKKETIMQGANNMYWAVDGSPSSYELVAFPTTEKIKITFPKRNAVPIKGKLTVLSRYSIRDLRRSSFENRKATFETLQKFFKDLDAQLRGNDLFLERRTIAKDQALGTRPPLSAYKLVAFFDKQTKYWKNKQTKQKKKGGKRDRLIKSYHRKWKPFCVLNNIVNIIWLRRFPYQTCLELTTK